MALTLNIANYSPNNILEKARVARDAAKGVSQFIIDNSQGIEANNFILIGAVGGSGSRMYQVQGVDGDNITLTEPLKAGIGRNTEVTKLFGNKIKVYTAPYQATVIPQTSDFTALVDENGNPKPPLDIDPDQLSTLFTDPQGSESVWYRYTYYNSHTTGETPLADSQAVRDVRSSNYCTLDDIRGEAGFNNASYITDHQIDRKRQAAQGEINGALQGKYVIPFKQPTPPQIVDLTIRLAAGLLMHDEYGKYDGSDKSRAKEKLSIARGDLKALQSGESVIVDAEGVTTTQPETGGGFSSGFSEDSPAMFTTGDIREDTRAY